MRYSVTSLCTAIVHLLVGAVPAVAAVYSLKPSITVQEEYTDNAFGTRGDRKEEFVTRALPRLAIQYKASLWDWDLDYTFDYRYYARNSRDDELTHTLNARGNLRVIDNFLFVDVLDTYGRVSLDVNRDRTAESLFVDQADQNILIVAPYVTFRPSTNLLVISGYHYRNELYIDSPGIDKEEHGAFITAFGDITSKTQVNSDFHYTYTTTGQGPDYDRFTPSLGFRWQYADQSFITLQGGYSWVLYADGTSFGSPYWNGSITHTFDTMTGSLNALIKYNSDPLRSSTEQRIYSGTLDKTLRNGTISLFTSYSELRDIQADLLLSTRYGVGGNIKRMLTERTGGHLEFNAEKLEYEDITSDMTPPYRFHVAAGVSYAMANELTVSLDYAYVTYRESVDSAADNIEINRAILGLTKAF